MARIKRTDIYNIDASPSLLDYVIGTDYESSLRTKNYRIGDLLNLLTGSGASNGILTGGVTWLQLLQFEVTDLTYILAETFHTADGTTVTLAVADPTNPRIDLIVVDADGSIYSITGVAAADPAKPIIEDNSLELEITFVEIAAAATTPTGISAELVYDENVGPAAEWTATENTSGARINLGDTTQPNTGTVDIAITTPTLAGGDTITFTSSTTSTVSELSTVHFYIYLVNTVDSTSLLKVRFFNSSTSASDIISIKSGSYGFDASVTEVYQSIILPTSEFTFTNTIVDVITFEFEAFPTGTYYIDTFNLITGVNNPVAVDNFLGLSDTPSSYLGQAGLVPRVNTGETALEFGEFVTIDTAQVITGNKQFSGTLATAFDQGVAVGDGTDDVLGNRVQFTNVTNPAALTSASFPSLSFSGDDLVIQISGGNSEWYTKFATSNTGARTHTLQDQSGTIAHLSDIAGGGGMVGFDATIYTNTGTGTEEAATVSTAVDLSTTTGDAFRIRAAGNMKSGSGTKTIDIKVDLDSGSQGMVVTNTIDVTTDGTWNAEVYLVRTGADSFMYSSTSGYYTTTGADGKNNFVAGLNGSALTFSGVALRFFCNIASTVIGTLDCETFEVEFIPAL
jgi:hypothetical protein